MAENIQSEIPNEPEESTSSETPTVQDSPDVNTLDVDKSSNITKEDSLETSTIPDANIENAPENTDSLENDKKTLVEDQEESTEKSSPTETCTANINHSSNDKETDSTDQTSAQNSDKEEIGEGSHTIFSHSSGLLNIFVKYCNETGKI